MREITVNIEKHIGILSEDYKGWRKELNLVSWNDQPAKWDIRSWSPDHEHMTKGLTFDNDEIGKLFDLLKNLGEE